jgi:hypothetical protein
VGAAMSDGGLEVLVEAQDISGAPSPRCTPQTSWVSRTLKPSDSSWAMRFSG